MQYGLGDTADMAFGVGYTFTGPGDLVSYFCFVLFCFFALLSSNSPVKGHEQSVFLAVYDAVCMADSYIASTSRLVGFQAYTITHGGKNAGPCAC